MLTIQLHKRIHKATILKCIRADKSETWSKLHPNTEYHDLAHIAVEKGLGFTNAFYGLVSQGVNISDFELPEHQKPVALTSANLPKESIITEHLVNLLTIEQFNAEKPINFIKETQKILQENQLPYPDHLTEQTLNNIRLEYSNLISEWKNIQDGMYLENTFDI
ncbi:hypothetical protein [uncultured Dokdonia sp.]|uniref:hypothetical protein n=1 Tax=uncultured Dokdonia sp. TaxID=575653 RepID=UPI0026199300|nr:hypothetical protein [uncultured Dokdonia sp.]